MKKVKFLLVGLIIASLFLNVKQIIGEEATQELDPLEWFEISSVSSIGLLHAVEWSFTSTNPAITIDVWIFDDSEFTTYSMSGSLVGDLLTQAVSGDSGYYFPETSSVWHVVFFNNDGSSPGTTTVTANVDFVERIIQNEGNSGADAGSLFTSAAYLDPDALNSSGDLQYTDCKDYYKFLVSEIAEITILIENLRNGNCNFTLYQPSGTIVANRDLITVDETIIFNATIFGYWIFSINKASCADFQTEHYDFKIVIQIPSTPTTPTGEADINLTVTFVSITFVFALLSIIIRKKQK